MYGIENLWAEPLGNDHQNGLVPHVRKRPRTAEIVECANMAPNLSRGFQKTDSMRTEAFFACPPERVGSLGVRSGGLMKYLLALSFLVSSPVFAQSSIGEQYNVTYSDRAEQATFNHAPNAFLVEFTKTVTPGRALDVGMGQGRNTVYLAQRGWQATGIDLSDVGVNLARQEAAKLGLKLSAIVADAQAYDFGEGQWDLVVFCYVPLNGLVERVARGLKPGGIVLVEDFHRDTAKLRLLPGDKGRLVKWR